MPANLSHRIAFSFALLGLMTGSVEAQLEWQSTGVAQASHDVPAEKSAPVARYVKPYPPASLHAQPQAKRPTAVAKPSPSAPPQTQVPSGYAEQRAVHSERVAQQAGAILQQANGTAAIPAPLQGVVPACHECGCGPVGCECGPMVDPSFGCGVGGCNSGTVCDEPCGCGDMGCCDDCGCGDPCCGNAGCCGECGCGDSCGACSYGGCRERGAVPLILFVPPIRELTFSAGVQGFKGPLDGPDDAVRDRGNFGFNESVNAGGPMSWLPWRSLGYQIGYRATHSQLHGSDIGDTADGHTQHFVTAGLYRRKPVGMQYGLVYDFLQDERIERMEFSQLRGLVSVTNPKGLEWGFQFATGLTDSETLVGDPLTNVLYEPVDQYLLFCRKKNPCGGGELRLFGGVTGDSKGIFGGDVDIPLGDRLSFQSGFTYLIPEDEEQGFGAEEEHWNLGMNLVWHYGKRAKKSYRSPFRPLFNVADNGSFLVDDSMD